MDSNATERFVPEYRRTNFKNKSRFQSDELRRRRETHQVDLRKQKREEVLAKRRNYQHEANDSEDEEEFNVGVNNDENQFYQRLRQDLPKMLEMIQAPDFDSQLAATVKFRQILSREHNPPIDLVIESGVIPTLVEFMKSDHPDMLQLEAAWALTNIASGNSQQTRIVVEANAVPLFVQLLFSQSLEVKEQAIWALGNVAGDSAENRDYVLNCGAMDPVLNLFHSNKMSLIRTATWTLSNLCRGKSPQPDWNIVSQAIPTLSKLIYSTDSETLVDACWAVSYLSDGTSEAIQAVIDARIPHRLVELLGHESTLVQTPSLRAIGNIVTGSDYQTQIVINAGVLPALAPLLNSTKDTIRKEACWTISNITAGTTDQIQAVIDANLIPQVIRLLSDGDYKTKKEACWAISNASSGGLTKPDQIRYLVSQGCIKPLCDLLSVADSKIIEVTLDSLENILKMGEMDKEARNTSVNENALYIEEAGGMEKIFECQNNANEKIYQKAYNIIEKYFSDEDEDHIDDENIIPESYGNAFEFGIDGQDQQQQNFSFQ
ncbi:Importin alpha subunit (Karyopherin alpha subunit) (Serine-rich RNA polymerase I suppressor protein) [Lodderomyces elongisporus]|uniref:Importin alpha subunit (Karyopherin alpha subunit) (Serine-rich RNA polymerase I suppressor protein) n=1 Tax=Lodderomyces elongisporus TaxID=36914 RepID=UPI00292746F6|nr:Importin alpha subunit (Karyopherin alpha subunit) (Serine-rich RNA polymerase I suppressor protein) [Lodderomyces elongisporus]WLF80888.1 Importin alpha subunit (Karyopherin alpha subunit) (Serine-rich RNA polymerase I suppressor protein) [Lodderomyces elongisporus]